MKKWTVTATLAVASAGFALSACSGGMDQSGIGAFSGAEVTPPQVRHRARARSWMSPTARAHSLLYVSDSERATVNVYAKYLSKKPVLAGQLTNFIYPSGECTDRAGNVYIADFYGVDIVEYPHASTTPIRTIRLQGFPIGCSVDPITGNLAVVIWEGAQGYNSPGGVFIFPAGSGTPALYTADAFQMFPPAYDDSGDLFLLGYNPTVQLLELPRGGTAFDELLLGSTQIWTPGAVSWDGKYINAVDQQYHGGDTTAIYRIAVEGGEGKTVHTTFLTDTCNRYGAFVFQPSIVDATIIGPNHSCSYRFDYWDAKTGGNPVRSLSSNLAPEDGNGQTISVAPVPKP